MMAQKKQQNQTKVKKTRKSEDIRPAVAKAALDLAAVRGWDHVTLQDIATESGLSEKAIKAVFDDIWDILAYVLQDIADKTTAEVKDYLTDDWPENTMEILMTRFDLAQDHRAAFKRLPRDLAKHPRTMRRLARRFYNTMREILLLASFPAEDINPATVSGFGLLYVSIVDTWSKDETPDMSRTMAAIDKRLGYFVRAASCLSRLPACPTTRD
jgi:AcrR family transcriptional regulator